MSKDYRDNEHLADRLRAARTRAGLTQEQAADRLSMARTTIVAIEKAQRRIRPNELRQMAEHYGVSVNSLLRPSAVTVDLVPRFRSVPKVLPAAVDRAARLLNDLAAAHVELEHILGARSVQNYPPERRLGTGDLREQAEDAALEMRQRLGLGLGAITDLIGLLEVDVGLRIFVRPLRDASISGLFIYDDNVGGCILVNQNHSRHRRTMTAAHEFGHFLTSRREPDILDDRGGQSREERFATSFAAALLMPAAAIRRRFDDISRDAGRFSPRHLIVLAHHFNVSEEALCRRLEELGLLPQGTWESLRERGFSGELIRQVLGDQLQEPSVSFSPRLYLLASEAYRRELLSEGQLARMLNLDRVQLREIFDALGTEEVDANETI